jgi:retron-type reverse transcriptase
MQIELWELFNAYYTCRGNKRNTHNALSFEVDYENNLVQLCNDLNNNNYKIRRSIAFIVKKPVFREIFAADFRDRVVHHLIINKLNPLFEKEFISDSYACRVDKGTHYGIKRVAGFIQNCSHNYTGDCYILKLDILGFFMHINRFILFERLEKFIQVKYQEPDKELLIRLCKEIIFNEPTQNCTIKGSTKNWEGLPNNKSLFHSAPGCGLPIGNLTSQVFANFYMNSLDHFIKYDLGIKYYGRYVDDFVIIHPDKEYLKRLIPLLTSYLSTTLQLTLHPKKQYLQHYTKGVRFLGTVIKPNRIYIGNRTKGNFYMAIQKQNKVVENNIIQLEQLNQFLSSMNSYLGIMKHYKTYRLRMGMLLKYLNPQWLKYVYLVGDKFGVKK